MATYVWTRSRAQLASMVLKKLGVIGGSEAPSSADSSLVYEAIDARLKELHVLGVLWWNVSNAQSNLSLTAGSATVSTPADLLFPLTLNLVVGTSEQPIEIVSHREYQAIPEKTESGEPVKALVGGGVVRLWPIPRANGTAKLTYQAIAADSAQAEALDIPVAMMRPFVDVLAGDLIDDFGIAGEKAARLERRQAQAMAIIRNLNTERVGNSTVEMESF